MANFVRHESCPKCGSRDNLGRYSDDSYYCFGCGFYGGPSVRSRLQGLQVEAVQSTGVFLPADSVQRFPMVVHKWLGKYSLSVYDVSSAGAVWSDRNESLIFPYYYTGNLIASQARYFGTSDRPKWYNRGKVQEACPLLGHTRLQTGPIVLVEDIVSAIKVGKLQRAVPLFMANLSYKKTAFLKKHTDQLIFWLDRNKAAESHRLARQASLLGFKTRVIVTEHDPKIVALDTIKDLLTG